ncbi:MAG: hypothetical protein HY597_06240 [Candidatus Omnitrophica bacterium]|nr:hypothetical protein [Candidatus Omnitrophota bacterium]
MRRLLARLSATVMELRAGERRKAWLLFAYFFCTITAYYVIKPVSRSLILGELGSKLVPHADLLVVLIMGPVVALFARLVDWLPKPRLLDSVLVFLILNLVGFWLLLQNPLLPGVSAVFYLWVSIFSVLVVTLFWLVANDLFHPRVAKRLYGFIGTGGILGGITGGLIAARGAAWFGTENLLLLSAGFLTVSLVLVHRLWRLAEHPTDPGAAAEPPAARERYDDDPQGFFRLLFTTRYLWLLLLIVGIGKTVATLIFYQFNPLIEAAFPLTDQRTAFLGGFYASLNATSFLVQFFVTSWCLRTLGVTVGLLLLPIGLLLGSVGLLLAPSLLVAAGTELYDGGLSYSLNQSSKEVLYLPLSRSVRYKVKPFIDMVVFRFAKSLAAFLSILCITIWHWPVRALSLLTIPLIVVWIRVVWEMRREYVETIKRFVVRRSGEEEGQPSVWAWARVLWQTPEFAASPVTELLQQLRRVPTIERKLVTAAHLAYEVDGHDREQTTRLLETAIERELTKLEGTRLEPWTSLVRQAGETFGVGRRGDPFATTSGGASGPAEPPRGSQEAIDLLLRYLVQEEDPSLRDEILRCLQLLQQQDLRLQFARGPMHQIITAEVRAYEALQQLRLWCRAHRAQQPPTEGPDRLDELLRVLLDEHIERVFRSLSLLYGPEDITLIYRQISTGDGASHADAAELLDNLLEPSLRRLLMPIIDEELYLESLARRTPTGGAEDPAAAQSFVLQYLRSPDRWLQFASMCAIAATQTRSLQRDIERFGREATDPFLRESAAIAMRALST